MKPAKPKTVRLRLSAEYNLDSDSARVLLFCDPKSAFGFLTSQFKPERLRVERIEPGKRGKR